MSVLVVALLALLQDPAAANYVDEFVGRRCSEDGVTPAPLADDATFLRRLSLDVLGTVPSADEARAFLRDADPAKRAKKVDELLARPEYARHWAVLWQKILLGGEAKGDGDPGPRLGDWLRDEVFAKDVPLDRMAARLVSARGATDENPATGFFLALSRKGGGGIPVASRATRVFMGVQIQCAQCHDHPFSPYTQEDFHGMVAFFARLKSKKKDADDKKSAVYLITEEAKGEAQFGEGKAKRTIPPKFLDGRLPEAGRPRSEEFARLLVDRGNRQFARAAVNRYWHHFFGRGLVQPVDDFRAAAKPSHPELLERLAEEFVERGCDPKALVRRIATSSAYQRSSRSAGPRPGDATFACAAVRPLHPEVLCNALLKSMTGSDAAPSSEGKKKGGSSREELLAQLKRIFADPENVEVADFDGTLPQALLLMNASAVNQAVTAKTGLLARVLASSSSTEERLDLLYLSVLGRRPRADEAARLGPRLASPAAWEDLAWALLNSSEFLFNH